MPSHAFQTISSGSFCDLSFPYTHYLHISMEEENFSHSAKTIEHVFLGSIFSCFWFAKRVKNHVSFLIWFYLLLLLCVLFFSCPPNNNCIIDVSWKICQNLTKIWVILCLLLDRMAIEELLKLDKHIQDAKKLLEEEKTAYSKHLRW